MWMWFSFLWDLFPQRAIAKSFSNSVFNLLGDCLAVLQSGWAILCPHWQGICGPFSHPYLALLFILTILLHIHWHLIVASICICLLANDIEHLLMSIFAICISSPVKHVWVSSPFSNWITVIIFFLFAINFKDIFIYPRNQQDMIIQDSVHKYFLPMSGLASHHLVWFFPECTFFSFWC